MTFAIRFVALIGVALLANACSKKDDVGGGYILVTPESLNPDAHPGTSLQRSGKTVWRNVYVGYFSDQPAPKFFHNNVFVFVGPLPDARGGYGRPQLFAVRGDGPPVLLTERLHGQRLNLPNLASDVSNHFEVNDISAVDGGVQIKLEYWKDRNTEAKRTIDVTWATIEKLVEEAASSGDLVRAPLGNYYALRIH